jgi:hypothetical protein
MDCFFRIVYAATVSISSVGPGKADADGSSRQKRDIEKAPLWSFSSFGGGVVAESEPGTELVGEGDICPLRRVKTGGSDSRNVGSEVCGNAANDE